MKCLAGPLQMRVDELEESLAASEKARAALQEQVDAIVAARALELAPEPVNQETHIHIHTTDTNVPHTAALAIYKLDRGGTTADIEAMDTTPEPEPVPVPDLTVPVDELKASVAALQEQVAVVVKTAGEKQTQELLVAKVNALELKSKVENMEEKDTAADIAAAEAELAAKFEPINTKCAELSEEVRKLRIESQKASAKPDEVALAKEMAGRLANLEEDMMYMASKEYCEEYCDELASSTRRYLKALDGGMQDIEVKVADMEDHLRQQPGGAPVAAAQPGALRAARSGGKTQLAMPPALDPAFSVRRVEKSDAPSSLNGKVRRSSTQKAAPGASRAREAPSTGRRRSDQGEAGEERRERRPERSSHGEGELRASRDRPRKEGSSSRPREGEKLSKSATLSHGSTRGGGYNVPPRAPREAHKEAWESESRSESRD
jgi:hypothetical protein